MGSTPRVAPFDAVAVTPSGFVAQTVAPWLEVRGLNIPALAGRFIEIVARASLLDEPTRPVFRFLRSDGSFIDRIGPAPICGAAIWVGRVPVGVERLLVSPTCRRGPFGFRIERLRVRRWTSLLAEAVRRRPKQTRSSILTRLIGWGPESDNNLAWAIGAFDLTHSHQWRSARHREFEPSDLDCPKFDWANAPLIRIIVRAGHDRAALAATLVSLTTQAFARWNALVVGDARLSDGLDRRVRSATAQEAALDLASADADVLFGVVEAGDLLPDYALAFLAEQRHRCPDTRIFYGDEVVADQLALKPGWSPRLQATRPFVGRAVFVANTRSWSDGQIEAFIRDGVVPLPTSADRSRGSVKALRRVLLVAPARAETTPPAELPDIVASAGRHATVIILTADHPALLRRAVSSVRAKSPPDTQILIVDNGRGDAQGPPLSGNCAEDGAVTVLHRPGPFNYSALCNEAVAQADGELLVFLNDDTEVLCEHWIERLAALAFEPDVGAVGARLTFPDGRLQHVGVLVGMGESAGHLGAMAPTDDPGWWRRNEVVHEVSAVTGACLAVARDKFMAVGGFDATDLPVELSDIDLCLKLNAHGWQTLVDPHVHLMHEESASRGGATFRRLTVYDGQRQVFVERWRHVLRDDPFFHPGLSLYSVPVALG